MTKEELIKVYPNGKLFENQYEMGQFLQEYGVRNKVEHLTRRWSEIKDNDNFYDISELALSKGVAFYNDGFYIVEDLSEIDKDI